MALSYCPYCMSPIQPGQPCPSCGLTEGTYTPAAHHLPPGTVLGGRYLVGRVLGEGGFGITYIGCDLRLELRVAIKEYYPVDRVSRASARSLSVEKHSGSLGDSFELSRDRFIKEARVMARMDKMPQIVGVRDFFQENNTAYIVMEYVDGTTLKELVAQRGGRLPAGELLPMVEPLFPALSAMHALGLIHRDISPDNIMLENGRARLLDFGCARETAQGKNSMTVVLKHGYSPIEQYQHKGQGPWTDVYSLAATLYYCLTGKTPPPSLDRICDEELIPPRQLGADLTPAQERAILRGMGLRRNQRYATVEEFHAALYQGADIPPEPVMPGDITVALEPQPIPAVPEPVMPDPEPAAPASPVHTPPGPVMPGDLTVPLEPERAMPGDLTVPLEPEPVMPEDTAAGREPGPESEREKDKRRLERLGTVGGIVAAALLLALLVWFLGGTLPSADAPPTPEVSAEASAEPTTPVSAAPAGLQPVQVSEPSGEPSTAPEITEPPSAAPTPAPTKAQDDSPSAEPEKPTSGQAGPSITWTLSDTGVLTLSGSGKMHDYYYDDTAPWKGRITSVVVEPGVTSIGNFAFAYCHDLTSVTLPEGVTIIGNSAFLACYSLISITLPESVTTIGDSAFDACNSLTSMTLPEGITTISSLAFTFCGNLTSVTLPAGVTTIDFGAFSWCSNLTTVYYGGTEEQWRSISIDDSNYELLHVAQIHYNS